MGVRIEATELWLGEYGSDVRTPVDVRQLPLDQVELDDLDLHIHGRLRVEVEGPELPHLGFFGPDDVCLYTWVPELARIRAALAVDHARYVFDEGEQGQPAFVFERAGDDAYVSIEASHIGGGRADPEWQRVPCRAADLAMAIDAFFLALQAQLLGGGPYGAHWWAVMSDRFELDAR